MAVKHTAKNYPARVTSDQAGLLTTGTCVSFTLSTALAARLSAGHMVVRPTVCVCVCVCVCTAPSTIIGTPGKDE